MACEAIFGVDHWFRNYIGSDEYAKGNDWTKSASFDYFMSIRRFLAAVEKHDDNDLAEDIVFYSKLLEIHLEDLQQMHEHATYVGVSAWFTGFVNSTWFTDCENDDDRAKAVEAFTAICQLLTEINIYFPTED